MFEKEIRELFDLSLRVMNETEFFVSFDIAAHTHCCYVEVMDSKWKAYKEYDGHYYIHFGNEMFKEESAEQYKLAKEHLLKLLIDGRCPMNDV
nr:MAG TPA: hypothetical protein [Caudoviricetes sp.]